MGKAASDARVDLVPQLAESGLYLARTRPGQPVVVPLKLNAGVGSMHRTSRRFCAKLAANDGRHYGAVKLHLVGAGALWAGMVDLTKEDLASAERVGFPIIAGDPARRVRLAGRRGTAAGRWAAWPC